MARETELATQIQSLRSELNGIKGNKLGETDSLVEFKRQLEAANKSLFEKDTVISQNQTALKELNLQIESLTKEMNKDVDFNDPKIQEYVRQHQNGIELETNRIVDSLQLEIKGYQAELKHLKEEAAASSAAGAVVAAANTTVTLAPPVDVKKLMSTIYDKLREAYPLDGEDGELNSGVLKTVRLVLKQIASDI